MATLTVTDKQLRLIQQALDFYSRIGIGQLDEIKDHPTFAKYLAEQLKDVGGYRLGTDDYVQFNLTHKPNWFHRTMMRLCFGYKWINL